MSTKKIISIVALSMLLSTGIASAQSTTTPTSTPPVTTTPGVPSTGAGGDTAANILMLAAAGTVALAGGIYLTRRVVRE